VGSPEQGRTGVSWNPWRVLHARPHDALSLSIGEFLEGGLTNDAVWGQYRCRWQTRVGCRTAPFIVGALSWRRGPPSRHAPPVVERTAVMPECRAVELPRSLSGAEHYRGAPLSCGAPLGTVGRGNHCDGPPGLDRRGQQGAAPAVPPDTGNVDLGDAGLTRSGHSSRDSLVGTDSNGNCFWHVPGRPSNPGSHQRPDLVHVHLNAIFVRVPIRAYSASASAFATLLMDKAMRILRCEPDDKYTSGSNYICIRAVRS